MHCRKPKRNRCSGKGGRVTLVAAAKRRPRPFPPLLRPERMPLPLLLVGTQFLSPRLLSAPSFPAQDCLGAGLAFIPGGRFWGAIARAWVSGARHACLPWVSAPNRTSTSSCRPPTQAESNAGHRHSRARRLLSGGRATATRRQGPASAVLLLLIMVEACDTQPTSSRSEREPGGPAAGVSGSSSFCLAWRPNAFVNRGKRHPAMHIHTHIERVAALGGPVDGAVDTWKGSRRQSRAEKRSWDMLTCRLLAWHLHSLTPYYTHPHTGAPKALHGRLVLMEWRAKIKPSPDQKVRLNEWNGLGGYAWVVGASSLCLWSVHVLRSAGKEEEKA